MELLKDVAAIIGLVLSMIALITACTKGGRALIRVVFSKNTKHLVDENKKQTQDIQEIKESLSVLSIQVNSIQEVSKQQCRNTIKDIYYRFSKIKKIPLFERKTADTTFEIYSKTLHGNSYIALLYKEIIKWEVIPPKEGEFEE